MAIARGAGTEIVRSTYLHNLAATAKPLIIGVQHHIYTVLSVHVNAVGLNSAGNFIHMYIAVYDSLAGTTAQWLTIFKNDMQVTNTYIWNDKFSFNGFEPTDFTGPADDATKHDAIADQGSAVSQKLYIVGEHSSDNFDVCCTYIDQNNA